MKKNLLHAKVVGENSVFPWKLGDILSIGECSEIGRRVYEIQIEGEWFIFQLLDTNFSKNEIFVKIFLTNNQSSGIVVFELIYD
jgi:hypothetical protein